MKTPVSNQLKGAIGLTDADSYDASKIMDPLFLFLLRLVTFLWPEEIVRQKSEKRQSLHTKATEICDLTHQQERQLS